MLTVRNGCVANQLETGKINGKTYISQGSDRKAGTSFLPFDANTGNHGLFYF